MNKYELPWTYSPILYKDKYMRRLKPLPLEVANIMVKGLVQLGGVVVEDELKLEAKELYPRLRVFNRSDKTDTGITFIPLVPYYVACIDTHMQTGIKYDVKKNPWQFNTNTLRMLEPVHFKKVKNK